MPTSSNLPGFAFTLLSLADGSRCAVKTLTRQPDGTIDLSEYDNGFEWWFKPFNIGADFDKHARLLRRYAQIDRVIMCMGDPKSGIDFNFYHQRLWARDDPPENTMVAVSRAWMPIDVDDAPVPPGLGAPGRYVEGAIHVRDKMLPEEFHGCTMVVSPSARTGLRGPALLRCRMWFLLDRPQELLALKAWTRGLKAVAGVGDSAVCQAGQPIYTGRARFVGMDDPIPPQLRAAVVRERMERVALAADRYAPAIVEIDRKLDRRFGGGGRRLAWFSRQDDRGRTVVFRAAVDGARAGGALRRRRRRSRPVHVVADQKPGRPGAHLAIRRPMDRPQPQALPPQGQELRRLARDGAQKTIQGLKRPWWTRRTALTRRRQARTPAGRMAPASFPLPPISSP